MTIAQTSTSTSRLQIVKPILCCLVIAWVWVSMWIGQGALILLASEHFHLYYEASRDPYFNTIVDTLLKVGLPMISSVWAARFAYAAFYPRLRP